MKATTNTRTLLFIAVSLLVSCGSPDENTIEAPPPLDRRVIRELNERSLPSGERVIAMKGGKLIDGTGGTPVENSCVLVRNNRIEAVGKWGEIEVPSDAEVVNVEGSTLLPGFFDSHYHNEDNNEMPSLYVRNGITSVRDPGEWIENYDSVRSTVIPLPRLFLTGPHLNTYPPAYPLDAEIVQDNEEAKLAVERLNKRGATAIKVYFGLPVGMIRQVCETAHQFGLPVTAHLEITNSIDAINAGLDGIEHVTSFGTVLIEPYDAEQYKLKVLKDYDARKAGRYDVWSTINVDSPRADSLIHFLSTKQTFLSPTLAAFEKQPGKDTDVEVHAFRNMLAFIGKARKAGVPIVVGSHTYVGYAAYGEAYFRELELLRDAGLTPMEIITAATLENARFFRVDERLGSIEPGKLADIVVVDGDPSADITHIKNVQRVMLNGAWVPK